MIEKFYCLDLRIPPHHWPGFVGRGQGERSRCATWGRCKPPRFSRHGLASGWWGAESKYLRLYLTCSQRNHGDAQQQAAFAALRARAQTVPPSHDMDPEHEAQPPRCYGVCTERLPTALITSEQKPSPRHAEVSMTGCDYTLGFEVTRPLQWNSRSTATQPLTAHLSWLQSVVFGRTFGHRGRIVMTTFAPSSRCVEQPKSKAHCYHNDHHAGHSPPCFATTGR